jgi:imidazolonepropionase-like amidohydrolase
MEAIIAGTRVSAEALGLDDLIGTVEKGKIADLIVLDSNPLQKIEALKNVIFVMKSGTIVRNDIAKDKESIK